MAGDYAAAMDDFLTAEDARLKSSLHLAHDAQPDQIARQRQAARSLGLPPGVGEASPAETERLAAVQQVERDTAAAPTLRQKYTNADFARLASDDSTVLAGIERVVRRMMNPKRREEVTIDPVMSGVQFSDTVRRMVERNPALTVDDARLLVRNNTQIENGPTMRGTDRSTLGTFIEPIRRGIAQGDRGFTVLLSEIGILPRDAGLAVRLANQQRSAERFPIPEDIAQGLQRITSAPSMSEAWNAIVDAPRSVLEISLQSLGSSAPALVGGIAGSTLGPWGSAAGAGAGSFAVEYANTIQDVMADRGIDGKDPLALYRAFEDPELLADARRKAVLRGVPIAAFDALTAGVAGRLLAGAKKGMVSPALRAAGELGIQAGGGAAGEATAQALTGEYKPGDILLEALAEMPSALVEVPSNVRHARRYAQAEVPATGVAFARRRR